MVHSTITNWMCRQCGTPMHMYAKCCGVSPTKAYTSIPCALCAKVDLMYWQLYSDGVTRPCPCSPTSTLRAEFPDEDKWVSLGAYVLSVIVNAVVGAQVIPVPTQPTGLRMTRWYDHELP